MPRWQSDQENTELMCVMLELIIYPIHMKYAAVILDNDVDIETNIN